MGGSRRRLKKNRPKVKVGVSKRKKIEKTKVPLEVRHQHDDIQKRLDKTWVAVLGSLQPLPNGVRQGARPAPPCKPPRLVAARHAHAALTPAGTTQRGVG
jgi:hypothetical protein